MNTVVVPENVVDLRSFRSWAHSDEYPERGRFAFLDGNIWADLSPEDLFTHVGLSGVVFSTLKAIVEARELGYLFVRGALLSNSIAKLATEPDAFFCSYDSVRSGRASFRRGGRIEEYREVEGSPDLTLEIVSDSSVTKDKQLLPPLYWKAGVPEFWFIDARQTPAEFQILRHTPKEYVPQPVTETGVFSPLFNRRFKLTQTTDRLGHPRFELTAQA